MTQLTSPTLLVTHDEGWPSLLCQHLWQNGFAPLTIAPTSDIGLELFQQITPRLVLVDLHLNGCNVIDLCTELLLAQPTTKVVLISDGAAPLPLAALHTGVSGCIQHDLPLAAWPGLLTYILSGGIAFNHTIIESILTEVWSAQRRQPLLAIGSLRIDLTRRLVQYAGCRIELTPREFSLLACLVRNTDRVVTFDQLLNEAWGYDADAGTPAQVRLYVARLRRKLLDEAQAPDFILSERGIGYRLHSGCLRQTPTPPAPLRHYPLTGHPLRTVAEWSQPV